MLEKILGSIGREGNSVVGVLGIVGAANKEIKKIKARGGVMDFERDPDGRWYAVFEHWPLDRSHLLMVAGADDLLDEMCSEGENTVSIQMSKSKKRISVGKESALLVLESKADAGMSGNYRVESKYNVNKVWICPVINFIFKGVQNYIEFKKV